MSSYDTKLYLRTRGASGRRHHFPKITIRIEEGTEVLFVEGVQRIDPFAGEIVFIENDPDKIVAFLPFCPKGAVILSDEDDLRPYVWKKKQFVGALKTTRATLHHLHLALSEYSRFGKEIVQNIKENLLHVGPFIHGKYLERRFSGKKVMVCGSGPSLSFERLKN